MISTVYFLHENILFPLQISLDEILNQEGISSAFCIVNGSNKKAKHSNTRSLNFKAKFYHHY